MQEQAFIFSGPVKWTFSADLAKLINQRNKATILFARSDFRAHSLDRKLN